MPGRPRLQTTQRHPGQAETARSCAPAAGRTARASAGTLGCWDWSRALLTLAAGLALVGPPGMSQAVRAQSAQEDTAQTEQPDVPALPVRIVTVTHVPAADRQTLIGTVQPERSYPVSFRNGGSVTGILVDIGDTVTAGQVIATQDATAANSQLASAQAGLEAANARLAQAAQAQTRARGLLDSGSGTRAALDAATEVWLSARSARDQAQAQREIAAQGVEDATIRAIEAATVIARAIDPGEIVGAGQPVVTLASQGRREIVFEAPDLAGLDRVRGQTAQLFPTRTDRTALTGVVSEVSPVLGAAGTVALKVRLDADTPELPIGSSVTGIIETEATPRIMLPAAALASAASGPAVWVVDRRTMQVTLVPVTLQGFTSTEIEISEGLSDGQEVVTDGAQQLYEGRRVQDVEKMP